MVAMSPLDGFGLFKAKGWNVMHIMAIGKADEHPYTSPAKIVNGKLSYGMDSGEK
jgi:hypothetical protein